MIRVEMYYRGMADRLIGLYEVRDSYRYGSPNYEHYTKLIDEQKKKLREHKVEVEVDESWEEDK